jgi:hypothetical protein
MRRRATAIAVLCAVMGVSATSLGDSDSGQWGLDLESGNWSEPVNQSRIVSHIRTWVYNAYPPLVGHETQVNAFLSTSPQFKELIDNIMADNLQTSRDAITYMPLCIKKGGSGCRTNGTSAYSYQFFRKIDVVNFFIQDVVCRADVPCVPLVYGELQRLDTLAWQEAAQASPRCAAPSRSDDCDGYEGYLNARPRGTHANEARALLAQARPKLAALKREEEAKRREAARTVFPRCVSACLIEAYNHGRTANREQCEAVCKQCMESRSSPETCAP